MLCNNRSYYVAIRALMKIIRDAWLYKSRRLAGESAKSILQLQRRLHPNPASAYYSMVRRQKTIPTARNYLPGCPSLRSWFLQTNIASNNGPLRPKTSQCQCLDPSAKRGSYILADALITADLSAVKTVHSDCRGRYDERPIINFERDYPFTG